MNKLKVGILGATGIVGQRFIELLTDHPFFEIHRLFATEGKRGRIYGEIVSWRTENFLPEKIARMKISAPGEITDCDLLFSALPGDVARDIEWQLALKGSRIISNASAHRMDSLTPLLIPEINPEHVALIPFQQREYGFGKGFIITNPNCSTTGLCLGILPLFKKAGVTKMNIVSMQAISGAGYPGVPALDILGNIIPEIPGEEEKLKTEPLKIFGSLHKAQLKNAEMTISVQCNRVPVRDGHLLSVSVGLKNKLNIDEVKDIYRDYRISGELKELPSIRESPVRYAERDFYQYSAVNLHRGMSVTVTRIEPCPVLDFRLVILVHNTIRGAAGGAILNGELLHKMGYFS